MLACLLFWRRTVLADERERNRCILHAGLSYCGRRMVSSTYLFKHSGPNVAVHEPNATIVINHSAGRLPTLLLVAIGERRFRAIRLRGFGGGRRDGRLRRLLSRRGAIGVLFEQLFTSCKSFLKILIGTTSFTSGSWSTRNTCDIRLRHTVVSIPVVSQKSGFLGGECATGSRDYSHSRW